MEGYPSTSETTQTSSSSSHVSSNEISKKSYSQNVMDAVRESEGVHFNPEKPGVMDAAFDQIHKPNVENNVLSSSNVTSGSSSVNQNRNISEEFQNIYDNTFGAYAKNKNSSGLSSKFNK